MERIFTGPTNADILDEIPEPITRHIYEMPIGGLATLPGAAYLRQVPSSLFRVSNLTLLAKRHVQFHRLLEGPEGIFNVTRQKELHDVYLVGAPERWSRLLRGQVHSAWSLYCEGHFYSLAKGSKGALIVKEFQCSDPDDVNQRALSPLIAYHLGKTDYAPAQIHRIARWVVTNMCQLSFSSKNDGHFVSALTLRIICTPRLSTVLLGSRSQIWARDQWIASAGSQLPIPSGFYTGYMIVGPNENAHGGCARQGRIFEVETAARCLAGCWTKGLLGQISQSLPKALATVALTMGEAHVNYGPPNTTRGYLEALGGPHGIKTLDTRLEKMDLLSYLDWEGSRWAIILGLRESLYNENLVASESLVDPI
ncbi:uncharacterized protein N7511_008495 [Penicillium nucicola]|uniref:uncharacterized protein n=1 Tax=Penicillium nucicola TaxID=1850975 RepID=UPI0025450B3F|nr:uncharacterized protein N7511_008495 [Penicillium nucicola]KAJ5751530.1 hypothetical protein N7511_008495 [Penicillium nucicola]